MTLVNDLRFALRRLRRSPAFTATAVLTLALGIGAATTMESVVRSTLLAPLHYPAQGDLVGVGLSEPGSSPNADQTGQTYEFLKQHARSFRSLGLADDGPRGANLSLGNGTPRTVRVIHVDAGYFPTLGVQPVLGRTFTTAEDTPGGAPAVLLGESLWRTAFSADPFILGRTVHLNADPYTVVGVLPAAAAPDSADPDSAQMWQPMRLSPADPGYEGTNYQLVGRLRDGTTPAQAAAELRTLNPELLREFSILKNWNGVGAPPMNEQVWPLRNVLVSQARSSILTLTWAVLAVLLVACLNLAGLLTARTSARTQELALRAALGAGRVPLLRLLMAESLLLALGGSALGLLLSRLALPLLLAASPIPIPQIASAGIDFTAVAFAVLTGCLAAVLFGLLPGLGVLRLAGGVSALGTGRTASASAGRRRVSRVLLAAQVAVATALLTAGALLLGSFLRMRAIPAGVRAEGLTLVQVNLKGSTYEGSAATARFVAAASDRLRALPGVTEIAAVVGMPLDHGLNLGGAPAYRRDTFKLVEGRFISPGYFHVAGTPLLAGEDISASVTASSEPVALINHRAAELWWPGKNAVGEYVVEGEHTRLLRVIGVVADAHDNSLAGGIAPTIYTPLIQTNDTLMKAVNGWFPTTFLLRGPASAGLEQAAARAIAQVDPEIAVARFTPMQTLVDNAVAAPRFFSWLAGAFAGFALLLTVIGLFGLLTYQVSMRMREFGVRMALGADRGSILTLILGEGLLLTGVGLVAGVVGSLFLCRLIASLLADAIQTQHTSDAAALLASPFASIGTAAAAMILCATLASLLPARRAARTNPSDALRSE